MSFDEKTCCSEAFLSVNTALQFLQNINSPTFVALISINVQEFSYR